MQTLLKNVFSIKNIIDLITKVKQKKKYLVWIKKDKPKEFI